MMNGLQFGSLGGDLEIRARKGGGKIVRGSFPYRRRAVISDGGRNRRPQKEEFDSHAFAHRVNDPKEEIHFLSGHRYDKPLASKLAGTLELIDKAEALIFRAIITPEIAETSHARDALALLTAGLATGISPGFRMPPERAVPKDKAETITEEPINPAAGQHGALIRLIHAALLFEISLVTQPAYPDAQAEARHWAPGNRAETALPQFLKRWRY